MTSETVHILFAPSVVPPTGTIADASLTVLAMSAVPTGRQV